MNQESVDNSKAHSFFPLFTRSSVSFYTCASQTFVYCDGIRKHYFPRSQAFISWFLFRILTLFSFTRMWKPTVLLLLLFTFRTTANQATNLRFDLLASGNTIIVTLIFRNDPQSWQNLTVMQSAALLSCIVLMLLNGLRRLKLICSCIGTAGETAEPVEPHGTEKLGSEFSEIFSGQEQNGERVHLNGLFYCL